MLCISREKKNVWCENTTDIQPGATTTEIPASWTINQKQSTVMIFLKNFFLLEENNGFQEWDALDAKERNELTGKGLSILWMYHLIKLKVKLFVDNCKSCFLPLDFYIKKKNPSNFPSAFFFALLIHICTY